MSAEGVRLLLRLAALEPFDVGSIDVKTAFLNAPVVTPNQEKVIARVPGILRTAGICTEKYWLVQKAMYGLDVAPRSWSWHRNGILQGITSLMDGTPVEVRHLDEDVKIWRVSRVADKSTITWLALYVDDMLLVGKTEDVQRVAATLQKMWTTTPVQWAAEHEPLTFDGLEIKRCKGSLRISQTNYITELLGMYSHVDGLSAVPAVREPEVKQMTDTMQEQVKLAQTIEKQLLWIAGRTRPDIAYAVNMIGQLVTKDPAEAISRAETVIKYLRKTADLCLVYGRAPDDFGEWDQLKFRRHKGLVEACADAGLAADSNSRSYGAAHLYWAGALVCWLCQRQPLIAASTAEAELVALTESHALSRSMQPAIQALLRDHLAQVEAVMYTDNSAALQLCTLDVGSWRTRHLRLREAIIRQSIETEGWKVSHLDGVFMKADVGTKPVGPARLLDLIKMMGMESENLDMPSTPPNPRSRGTTLWSRECCLELEHFLGFTIISHRLRS